MKIVVIYHKDNAVSYHRLLIPFSYIDEDCLFVDSSTPLLPNMLEGVQYVIWNRECPYDLDLMLQWRNIFNFKIVVDIDDYWYLPHTHIFYMEHTYFKKSENIILAIEVADIVTCTHSLLKEELKVLNENVYVLPNAIPFDKGQFVKQQERQSNKLLYVSSVTHYMDIKSISSVIQYLNNLTELKFIVAGYSSIHHKEWVKIQNIVLKSKNSYFLPSLPLSSYMALYNVGSVSIAPLEDNKFSTMKSALKIIEAGCKEVPIICSNIHPYSEFKDVPGVYLCSSNKEWKETIKYLYHSPNIVLDKGVLLGEYVRKNFQLDSVNSLRKKLFS